MKVLSSVSPWIIGGMLLWAIVLVGFIVFGVPLFTNVPSGPAEDSHTPFVVWDQLQLVGALVATLAVALVFGVRALLLRRSA